MASLISKVKLRLKIGTASGSSDEDSHRTKILRRKRLYSWLFRNVGLVSTFLAAVGYIWLLLLPLESLGQSTYGRDGPVDENAIQPAQVNVKYNWDEVHTADRYLEFLEDLIALNVSSYERALAIQNQFSLLGLQTSTQNYTFATSLTSTSSPNSGTNVYASFVPPRTSGTEAIVISASWRSVLFQQQTDEGETAGERMLNLRGIASVLSLAEYLRHTNHYAKTLLFVISDGHLEGMQAFLSSYHGVSQSNLQCQDLSPHLTGVIWTSLVIDYPGHSFSHLSLLFEGVNGRLPNQDLINTVMHIARYQADTPVRLYNIPDELHPVLGLNSRWITAYYLSLKGMWENIKWAGLGRPSAPHGVFHQYRIDSITLFCPPAEGPHGFHALGRIMESSLRSLNNLLERLHASVFFYLYFRPSWTSQVGKYLPATVLIGSSWSIRGIGKWMGVAEGGQILKAGILLTSCHIAGFLVWVAATQMGWFEMALDVTSYSTLLTLFTSLLAVAIASVTTPILNIFPKPATSFTETFSALTHLLVGLIIPILSMLNFTQAALLSVIVLPSLLCTFATSLPAKVLALFILGAVNPVGVYIIGGSICGRDEAALLVKALVSQWEILGNWTWPGVWVIYVPLVLQVTLSIIFRF